MADEYKGWSYIYRADYDDERLARYTVAFYREAGSSGVDWYDEIRYDSHEGRRGRAVLAPHLHLKIRSALKPDIDAAIAEIKGLIDNDLEGFQRIAHAGYRPAPPGTEDASEI